MARIDAARNAFDRVIAVGLNAYPQGIGVRGKLWVVNVTNKTLMEIDPSSGEESGAWDAVHPDWSCVRGRPRLGHVRVQLG